MSKRFFYLCILFIPLLAALPASLALAAPPQVRLVSGPAGGTFDVVGDTITRLINEKSGEMAVSRSISAGSVENLRRLSSGEADLGIVYAGDLFLAQQGRLPYDARTYNNVLPAAYLYSAPAQMLVRQDSDIETVEDLAGKRVAIGGPGSGAAAAAQLYLTSIGLWDRIRPDYTGYQEAVSALAHRYIDAIWLFAALPTPAATHAAEAFPVRLLDLHGAGDASGFFTAYPFFAPTVIPAGTYPGLERDVSTFSDRALLTAGAQVPEEAVREVLRKVFSAEGLDRLGEKEPSLANLNKQQGVQTRVTPLHPGAIIFWKEQGLQIPAP